MKSNILNSYSHNNLGQLKIYQRTVNSAFSLGDEERLVLLFVLERTIRWGRVWERISESEFFNGVFRRRNGQRMMVVRGTRVSAAALDRAIASLRQMEAIETHTTPSGTSYRINESWRHPELLTMGNLDLWDLNESDYVYPEERGEGAS